MRELGPLVAGEPAEHGDDTTDSDEAHDASDDMQEGGAQAQEEEEEEEEDVQDVEADAADGRGVMRNDNQIIWGPWSYSACFSKGQGGIRRQVGYGGNCNQHFNCKGQACKRMFTYAGVSDDECRCLVKAWLLLGHTVAAGKQIGRDYHVLHISRRAVAASVRPEAEMDSRVAALLARGRW